MMASNAASKSQSTLTTQSVLSPELFERFAALVHQISGISLGPQKILMLQSRLQKRLRATGVPGFEEYYKFLEGSGSAETVAFINAVTTNKTGFYRESHHFEILGDIVAELRRLPAGLEKNGQRREIHAWSAGCSSGEEAYTMAMTLDALLDPEQETYRIWATDIDTAVLDAARNAIYPQSDIAALPEQWQFRYFLRGIQKYSGHFRVVPELRERVVFQHLNFMDSKYNVPDDVDVIFCRNVMIYFSTETKARLVQRFCRHLRPGGFLFIGHSESLTGVQSPLISVAQTVYRKPLA